MCGFKELVNNTGATIVKPEDHLIHYKRAAIAFGIIALVSVVAIAVLFFAPHVATVGAIAAAIAFCGGIGTVYIGLGAVAGVSAFAALFFKGCVWHQSS